MPAVNIRDVIHLVTIDIKKRVNSDESLIYL